MPSLKRKLLFTIMLCVYLVVFVAMTCIYNMFRFFYDLPEIQLASPNDPLWRGLLFLSLNLPAFIWLGVWSHRQYIQNRISRKVIILGVWFGIYFYYYASNLPFEFVTVLGLTGSLSINLTLAFYFALMPTSILLGLVLAKVAFPLK